MPCTPDFSRQEESGARATGRHGESSRGLRAPGPGGRPLGQILSPWCGRARVVGGGHSSDCAHCCSELNLTRRLLGLVA